MLIAEELESNKTTIEDTIDSIKKVIRGFSYSFFYLSDGGKHFISESSITRNINIE
ncbi:hypothetical protein BD780_001288 [Clostridium tetanomorphum]|uniref:Uncharacterized protein n=1 Tax=Clostridium tetanomorphum TaxID=1553 RepID=A0A923ECD1_CLOTT|nr:hypothetical protein [Clostridium tetanomorphum]MBC2397803.1 hypothetical protein [Clostridium tetanomorphum]MBP1864594.1 hypothetical protein [Clostridium tetanomorphum]NRS84063.1 hypothetical protein [Clostridium tetanomorphum]